MPSTPDFDLYDGPFSFEDEFEDDFNDDDFVFLDENGNDYKSENINKMDNNNPLKLIFKLNSKGECTSQLESIPHISKFFE